MLATAVLTIPLGIVIVRRQHADSVLELDRAAERTAAGLDADVGRPGASIDLPAEQDELSVTVYDAAGRRLAGTGPASADAVVRRPGLATTDGRVGGERVLARPVTIDDRRVATIRVAEAASETTDRVRRDLLLLAGVDLVAMAVAAAVGAIVAGLLARPLRQVRDDAVRLGGGDFGIGARTSGVTEIDETSAALAETAGRLDAVLQRERTFSANASHQLRTPVTSMRLAVESELATPRPERDQVLGEVLADLDRLESTISTLLAVARDLPRQYEPIDVDALVGRLEARWEPPLEREGRSLEVDGDGPAATRVSPAVLDEILDVLVDNAIRHGAGRVAVSIAVSGPSHIEVVVADEGRLRGDPEALFRRRTPGEERHGLGLALARSLAEAEGGRLVLAAVEPTTFRLVLPDRG